MLDTIVNFIAFLVSISVMFWLGFLVAKDEMNDKVDIEIVEDLDWDEDVDWDAELKELPKEGER